MAKNRNQYFILLMDIVGSSKMEDRGRLTTNLTKTISSANREFASQYYAPFEITKGDEVAAILNNADSVYDIILFFGDHLTPVKVRSVVVFGKLSAGLETRRSTIIDGPAFYRADESMRRLKKTAQWVSFSTRHVELDRIIETLINLILMKWYSFTPLQRTIIRAYQKDRNQIKVANRLHKKQQQIQNTLMKCGWEILDQSELLIRTLCSKLTQENAITGGD
jgi:hypothetical protein